MTDGERIFAVNMADSWTVMTNITQVSVTYYSIKESLICEVKEIGINFFSLYMYIIQFFFGIKIVNIYLRYVWGMVFLPPNGNWNVWEFSSLYIIQVPSRYFVYFVGLITLLFYLITPFFGCLKVYFRKGNGRMQWPLISIPGDTGGEPTLTTTSPWRTLPRSLLQQSGQWNNHNSWCWQLYCKFLLWFWMLIFKGT